ncbi:MAG: Kelch repeat-containing protein [Emticicia sp.]|uniref:Kelch repeat-containing protein n=1 Tax=Emticicia sp. TaxID=1930953 RepID=UPI003BA71DD8
MYNIKSHAFAFSPYKKNPKLTFTSILLIISLSCFSQNQWTWMAGYLVSDAVWIYPRPLPSPLSVRGTPWILGSNVKPSVREHPAGGIVNNNDIYVYGGAALENEYSSDFWIYDVSQQKWAFISDLGWQVIIDVIGRESTTAHPGGRNRAASAVDKNGNIWFFGGLYRDKNTNETFTRSDLWRYNTQTKKFTYFDEYAGSQSKPSDRYRARAWFDNNNNMWMYGGAVDTQSGSLSYNDLWKFNTTTYTWTFISGNKNQPYCKNCPNGVYPTTPGISGTQYFPRARSDYGYWQDNSGNVWIYGGYAESHGSDEYGDLWKFNPVTSEWTLISGSSAMNPPQTATNPGSRNAPYCWVGNDNKLYMTGGLRQYSSFLRDIWRINPTNGNWEAVKVDNSTNNSPISAGFQIESPTNLPGASVNTLNHLTTGSHTYMFSGYGMGSNNLLGFTGAMWRYSLDGYDPNLVPVATPDSLVLPYRDSIACNIRANDLPKGLFNNASFDIDVNLAGIQKTLSTSNGNFSVDSLGTVWFKPRTNFLGTVTLSYTYQNMAKYVSNTAQAKIIVYKCGTRLLSLASPVNDINNGVYQYTDNEEVRLTNKIIPAGSSRSTVNVNAAASIVLLPGSAITPNNGSTFEAKISGCN